MLNEAYSSEYKFDAVKELLRSLKLTDFEKAAAINGNHLKILHLTGKCYARLAHTQFRNEF